jgi:hypothetical protein
MHRLIFLLVLSIVLVGLQKNLWAENVEVNELFQASEVRIQLKKDFSFKLNYLNPQRVTGISGTTSSSPDTRTQLPEQVSQHLALLDSD